MKNLILSSILLILNATSVTAQEYVDLSALTTKYGPGAPKVVTPQQSGADQLEAAGNAINAKAKVCMDNAVREYAQGKQTEEWARVKIKICANQASIELLKVRNSL